MGLYNRKSLEFGVMAGVQQLLFWVVTSRRACIALRRNFY